MDRVLCNNRLHLYLTCEEEKEYTREQHCIEDSNSAATHHMPSVRYGSLGILWWSMPDDDGDEGNDDNIDEDDDGHADDSEDADSSDDDAYIQACMYVWIRAVPVSLFADYADSIMPIPHTANH